MEILRYAAFSRDPAGGNPAGVVLDASGLTTARMQSIAAEVGYSETAFLTGSDPIEVRYFSPLAEVPFCGHATVAAAVAYAERHGPGELAFQTQVGPVRVVTTADHQASLVSVAPQTAPLPEPDLRSVLAALGWSQRDLDPDLPARVAFAGAWHPIIAARTRARLADLSYDFDALGALMADRSWTTVNLVWRESPTVFHARNPFPPGGIVEDPATGAAAAALGGYLRELGRVDVPATLTIHQGDDLGRPGLITVGIPASGGITVTGSAVALEA